MKRRRLRFDSLDAAIEEIDRLTQIVDGLNFLTKADAGLLHLDRTPVALDELVHEACADARVLAEPAGITVRSDGLAPIAVAGDRRRLRQLLLILTDNAIKYNHPRGSVDIRLRRENDAVLIEITNTGAGIPPEQLDRVFERFFRVDASHNRTIEGCGLGLSIARRIVEAHGGSIRIESDLGQPTTVCVRIPARKDVRQTLPAPIANAA